MEVSFNLWYYISLFKKMNGSICFQVSPNSTREDGKSEMELN